MIVCCRTSSTQPSVHKQGNYSAATTSAQPGPVLDVLHNIILNLIEVTCGTFEEAQLSTSGVVPDTLEHTQKTPEYLPPTTAKDLKYTM